MKRLCQIFLCYLAIWRLDAASFTATLDRNTIMVGEQATLTLTFDSPAQGVPALPSVPGITINYAGNSTSATIDNGVMQTSYSYNYAVAASSPGEYLIPALRASLNGVTVASQPLKLTVTKNTQAAAQASYAFLKLIVPKTNIYLGEMMVVDTPLYIIDGNVPQFPQLKGDGFVLGKQPQPNQTRTQIGNNVYHVVNFRQTISAAKIGQLTLGPAEVEAIVRVPVNRRRGASVFDDFFDLGREQRKVTLTTDPEVINVLPLPRENVPPSFTGAVGVFDFTVTAGPTNVSVGDPITLHYVIRGIGNLDALTLPAIDWREFKTYNPSSSITNTDGLGMQGLKTFEQVVIPQNAEIKSLPDIAFSFFDPNQKIYRTVSTGRIPLQVIPTGAAQAQPTIVATPAQAAENPQTARDIVHIKPALGVVAPPRKPLLQQPAFLAFQALPVAAWLGALLLRRRKEFLASNPRLRRKIAVAETVRAGLRDLTKQAEANQPADFYSTLFRLLQEQMGERLDLPASAITESVIDERPELSRLAPDARKELHDLFQACNQARYAPQASPGELSAVAARARTALENLKNLPQK